MKLASAALILLIGAATSWSQAPSPEPPLAPTLDSLTAKLEQVRKQKATLEREEKALVAEIQKLLRELTDKLRDLGVLIPDAPPRPPEPKPPEPKPPEPKPPDTFKADLARLFAGDSAANKKLQAAMLAAVYRIAAKEAMDPANAMLDELLSLISDIIKNYPGLDAAALKSCRDRVKQELNNLGIDAELTEAARKRAAEIYTRAAAVLEEAGK